MTGGVEGVARHENRGLRNARCEGPVISSGQCRPAQSESAAGWSIMTSAGVSMVGSKLSSGVASSSPFSPMETVSSTCVAVSGALS